MATLGIDVDGVVVDSCNLYLDWLEDITGVPLLRSKGLNYYTPAYYQEELKALGMDGMEFWRDSTLYDKMEANKDAVRVLTKLHKDGHKIVWVSAIKGDHHKSKVEFLKRSFPFWYGMIATKEKQYAKIDLLLDDRVDNLLALDKDVVRFLYESNFSNTEYTQEDEIIEVTSWDDFDWNVRMLY